MKAAFYAKGSRGKPLSEAATATIIRAVRTQSLVNLRLAGQFFNDTPAEYTESGALGCRRPLMMRAMLVANMDVANDFANGTIGRIAYWAPEAPARQPIRATHPELMVRFYKESSLQEKKAKYLPELDFLDLQPRAETVVNARAQPVLYQLQLQPAYGLVVHKVQSLTIRHAVCGCLEGVFALGQIYVLWSRVTDPKDFLGVGLPPFDLLDDVIAAWERAGLDADACMARAVSVTNEWGYTPSSDPRSPVASRLWRVREKDKRVHVKAKTLAEILNPQPKAQEVLQRFMSWMDRADLASQRGDNPPPFATLDGSPILPDGEEWWLTEVSARRSREGSREGAPSAALDDATEDDMSSESSDATCPSWSSASENMGEAHAHSDDPSPFLSGSIAASSSHGRPPCSSAATTDTPPPAYPLSFERQELAKCGKHALNNALGGERGIKFTDKDLKDACDNVVFESLLPDREGGAPSDPTVHEDHMKESGWYSEQVLAETLRQSLQFDLCLQPLHSNPYALYLDDVVGAVVNQNNNHWVAVKKIGDNIWLLNSTNPEPEALTWREYMSLITTYPNTFPIRRLPMRRL